MPPSSRHYSPAKGAASSSELVAGDAATAGSYATRDGKTRCGTRHVARTWTLGMHALWSWPCMPSTTPMLVQRADGCAELQRRVSEPVRRRQRDTGGAPPGAARPAMGRAHVHETMSEASFASRTRHDQRAPFRCQFHESICGPKFQVPNPIWLQARSGPASFSRKGAN